MCKGNGHLPELLYWRGDHGLPHFRQWKEVFASFIHVNEEGLRLSEEAILRLKQSTTKTFHERHMNALT